MWLEGRLWAGAKEINSRKPGEGVGGGGRSTRKALNTRRVGWQWKAKEYCQPGGQRALGAETDRCPPPSPRIQSSPRPRTESKHGCPSSCRHQLPSSSVTLPEILIRVEIFFWQGCCTNPAVLQMQINLQIGPLVPSKEPSKERGGKEESSVGFRIKSRKSGVGERRLLHRD